MNLKSPFFLNADKDTLDSQLALIKRNIWFNIHFEKNACLEKVFKKFVSLLEMDSGISMRRAENGEQKLDVCLVRFQQFRSANHRITVD